MPYDYKAKLRRVVDGDTIDVDLDLGFGVVLSKQRIRLYGINTPESRTRDLEEKARGLAAKARLKEMLQGNDIIVQTQIDKKARGKYGRILGTIIVDGLAKSANDTLVEEGHAVYYWGGSR